MHIKHNAYQAQYISSIMHIICVYIYIYVYVYVCVCVFHMYIKSYYINPIRSSPPLPLCQWARLSARGNCPHTGRISPPRGDHSWHLALHTCSDRGPADAAHDGFRQMPFRDRDTGLFHGPLENYNI